MRNLLFVLGLLTKTNQQLRMDALINQIESTEFDFFEPYIKSAIQIIREFPATRDLKFYFRFANLKS